MSQFQKQLMAILCGAKDKNIAFDDLCSVLTRLGFEYRIRGDHYIFTHEDVAEIINLQPVSGKAKPYQVKQVRGIILKYQFGGIINE